MSLRAVPFALAALVALTPGTMARAASPAPARPAEAVATFAGGCFWCLEPPFDKLAGVKSTTSGYTGGRVKHPTYAQVSAGGTGHAEAVRVVYDPARISYTKLLDVFWHNIDPLTAGAQFCDKGDQYRSAVFYHDPAQRKAAEATKQALAKRFGRPIATEIVPSAPFYAAEDYHQDYYLKNPTKYKFYRWNCGRDQRLEMLWGATWR